VNAMVAQHMLHKVANVAQNHAYYMIHKLTYNIVHIMPHGYVFFITIE